MVAALASFLDARKNQGFWHLRIDDIDPPRAVAGSVESILHTLEQHGLAWDGPIRYQSHSASAYQLALEQLENDGWVFQCRCTRANLTSLGECGQNCRITATDTKAAHSLRVRVLVDEMSGFEDGFLGFQPVAAEETPADFIVRRRDGLFAYQLAAAVDDARPHHTHIVRGADLLESTHRQRWLQQILGLASPQYAHVPVILDNHGNKLSKQTGAEPVNAINPGDTLRRCLEYLSQKPPPASAITPDAVLDHATAHWTGAHPV